MENAARRLGAAVVAAVLITGCAPAAGGSAGPVVGTQDGQWVEVQVQNGTAASLRVSAVAGTSEIALGRVSPLSTRTMRIPSGMGGAVRLVARPSTDTFGNREHSSEPFTLYPGHQVRWDLRASPGVADVPRLSTIRIIPCAPGTRC